MRAVLNGLACLLLYVAVTGLFVVFVLVVGVVGYALSGHWNLDITPWYSR